MKHTPYGYRIEGAKAVICEPEAAKLRAFFEEYIICKSMRAAGMKVGIDKTHSVLGRLLRNEKYLGTDYYPGIIDQKTFDEVQMIRTRMQNHRIGYEITSHRLQRIAQQRL